MLKKVQITGSKKEYMKVSETQDGYITYVSVFAVNSRAAESFRRPPYYLTPSNNHAMSN